MYYERLEAIETVSLCSARRANGYPLTQKLEQTFTFADQTALRWAHYIQTYSITSLFCSILYIYIDRPHEILGIIY